jgi:hypothetical protein
VNYHSTLFRKDAKRYINRFDFEENNKITLAMMNVGGIGIAQLSLEQAPIFPIKAIYLRQASSSWG